MIDDSALAGPFAEHVGFIPAGTGMQLCNPQRNDTAILQCRGLTDCRPTFCAILSETCGCVFFPAPAVRHVRCCL